MRSEELSAGGTPPNVEGSEVTLRLCRAVYARPAPGSDLARGKEALLRTVEEVLRDPARSVPSYGYDLVPVLLHAVRAGQLRFLRGVALAAVFGLAAWVWDPFAVLIVLVAIGLNAVLKSDWPGVVLFSFWLASVVPTGVGAMVVGWWNGGRFDSDAVHDLVLYGLVPVVLLTAVALVYVADGVVARMAVKRVSRERWPSVGPRTRARVERVGTRQNDVVLPYDGEGRFVGAGRNVPGAAEIRVPLRASRLGRPVTALSEQGLLGAVGVAMTAAARGEAGAAEPLETAPLPGFSVAHVLALPAALWLEHSRSGAGTPETVAGLGRPGRPYLRAQCVSWQGHLVVSLFVHVALQSGELRLTLRPQVMAPLRPLPGPAGSVVAEGLRNAAALLLKSGRASARKTGRAESDGPLSLRDALSQPGVFDLHQAGDAARHVELMRAAVLRAVEDLLERHGFETEAFSDRRAVINSIQVVGDNIGGIQLTGGLSLNQVTQTTSPAPSGSAPAAEAVTEGVPMSPGSHRDPFPDPARPPGAGISIGGDNSGVAQNAFGHSLSHVTQTGTGQIGTPLDSVAALLSSFRSDIDRNASLLTDEEALRDQTTALTGALAAPDGEGFRPALRMAVRSLPGLVAGTAVQQTGEALVTAIRELLG